MITNAAHSKKNFLGNPKAWYWIHSLSIFICKTTFFVVESIHIPIMWSIIRSIHIDLIIEKLEVKENEIINGLMKMVWQQTLVSVIFQLLPTRKNSFAERETSRSNLVYLVSWVQNYEGLLWKHFLSLNLDTALWHGCTIIELMKERL